VTDNCGHGIMVDKAGGMYEENAVTGNSGDGFYLRNAATPEARGNELARNEGKHLSKVLSLVPLISIVKY